MEKLKFTVGEYSVFVFDNLVTPKQIDEFCTLSEGLSFTRKEYDNKGDAYCIFSAEFIPSKVETNLSVGMIGRKLVSEYYPHKNYKLYRSYLNMSHYGDMAFPHRDCSKDRDDVTVLYYGNREWNYTWGGGTVFYENGDSRLVITPKPGRFVLFPGSVEHKGEIPTRICNLSRFSFAMKYRSVN